MYKGGTEKIMTSSSCAIIIVVLILSLHEERLQGQEEVVDIPTCPVDQFLTSDGTYLYCRTLPDAGFCDCPDLLPNNSSGNVIIPTFPLPPPGCEQYEPPIRGAFVCLRRPTIIYCSVLCDYRFEFFIAPRNPYFCGESTGFVWRDGTDSTFLGGLPSCLGFRHRPESLYPIANYLPVPCYGLKEKTTFSILNEFFQLLVDRFDCTDCNINDVFLRCPNVPARAQFYSDIEELDRY